MHIKYNNFMVRIIDGLSDFKPVIDILKKGRPIAFPTDTVYGIGVDAFNSEAISLIYKIKKRTEKKPLVLFVKDRETIKRYAYINKTAQKLIENFLPGPLTLILKAKNRAPEGVVTKKGTVGIRIPDNEIVSKLLREHSHPLATTSANISGEDEISSASSIASIFKNRLGIVVDGGELKSKIPSTVLDCSVFPPILLRKGRVSIFSLEKFTRREIKLKRELGLVLLLVCTGNCCRSPMGVGVLKKKLPYWVKKRVRILSCGTSAFGGSPPTENAKIAARERGADISLNRSRSLSRDLITEADLILVFERKHLERVKDLVPESADKTFLLKEFKKRKSISDENIKDPIGGSLQVYRNCISEIEKSLKPVIKYLERKI